MNMIESQHESAVQPEQYPGQTLARAREARGFTQEFVAGKLHLRHHIVHLLEMDAYQDLPQPVFIQGYYRAYAKLLGIDPAGILEQYNLLRAPEKKVEKILRQRDRDPKFRAFHVSWVLAGLSLLLVIGVGVWFAQHNAQPLAQKSNLSMTATQPLNAVKQDNVLAEMAPTDLSLSLVGDASTDETTSLSIPEEKPLLERKDG